MKGLILAAGRGTRLRPLTHTRPKPAIRVAGRPIIHYAVENLLEAGVREIGVVVSPETERDLKVALEGYPVRYVLQEEPQGWPTRWTWPGASWGKAPSSSTWGTTSSKRASGASWRPSSPA